MKKFKLVTVKGLLKLVKVDKKGKIINEVKKCHKCTHNGTTDLSLNL